MTAPAVGGTSLPTHLVKVRTAPRMCVSAPMALRSRRMSIHDGHRRSPQPPGTPLHRTSYLLAQTTLVERGGSSPTLTSAKQRHDRAECRDEVRGRGIERVGRPRRGASARREVHAWAPGTNQTLCGLALSRSQLGRYPHVDWDDIQPASGRHADAVRRVCPRCMAGARPRRDAPQRRGRNPRPRRG